MKREIKFRGKCERSDEWCYGSLVDYGYDEMPEIQGFDVFREGNDNWKEIKVIPETVGQFTGLYDKNGKEIYEGDIGKTKEYGKFLGDKNFSGYDHFEVLLENGGFRLENEERIFNLTNNSHIEVIGNVHDNPELLKEK